MSTTCSTAEAAQRLGVSVQTVQRWVDLGQLRAWKTLGGHRRIDVASVDALQAAQAASLAPAAPAVEAVAPAPGGLRVLVVDDDDADRDLLALLSRKALGPVLVETVTNGFEALLAIGRTPPDILVTDVMMPHMNGFEMLKHLSDSGLERPAAIVATSSYTPSELAAFGRLPDGVVFIAKPIDRDRFFKVLQQARAPADPHG